MESDKTFEKRWCKFCITKTKHEILIMSDVNARKRRRLYKCTECGRKSWLQGYRPTAESLY